MSALRSLIGNWIRFRFTGNHSNLEDRGDWDHGLLYRRFIDAERYLKHPIEKRLNMLGRFHKVVRVIRILTYLGIWYSLGFVDPRLIILILLVIPLIYVTYGYRRVMRCLNLRIGTLASDALGYNERKSLTDFMGRESRTPRDIIGKKDNTYRFMLLCRYWLGRGNLILHLIQTMMILCIGLFNTYLYLLPVILLGLDRIQEYIEWRGLLLTRYRSVLPAWEDILRDHSVKDGRPLTYLQSHVSFGLLLLRFEDSKGLLGGIHGWIGRWYFRPSRLRKMMTQNKRCAEYYGEIIHDSTSNDEDLPYMEFPLDYVDDDDIAGENKVNGGKYPESWVYKDRLNGSVDGGSNPLFNVGNNPAKARRFLTNLRDNGSLLSEAWLTRFGKDDRIDYRYNREPAYGDHGELVLRNLINDHLYYGMIDAKFCTHSGTDRILNDRRRSWVEYLDLTSDVFFMIFVEKFVIMMDKIYNGMDFTRGGSTSNEGESRYLDTESLRSILSFHRRNELDDTIGILYHPSKDSMVGGKIGKDTDLMRGKGLRGFLNNYRKNLKGKPKRDTQYYVDRYDRTSYFIRPFD